MYEKFEEYQDLFTKHNDKYGYTENQDTSTIYSYRNELKEELEEFSKPLSNYEAGKGDLPQCDEDLTKHCFVRDEQAKTTDGEEFLYTGEKNI